MADGKDVRENHVKTLFVRHLPHDATTEQLESVFSECGPLKRCFIVKEKGTERGRGFGYVTFALREDAETASAAVHTLNGHRLGVSFAKERPDKKKNKKKLVTAEQSTDEPAKDAEPTEAAKPTAKDGAVVQERAASPVRRKPKKTKPANAVLPSQTLGIKGKTAAATVVLKGFKKGVSKAKLQNLLKTTGIEGRAELAFPVEGWTPPTALIRFQNKREAVKSVQLLQKWKPAGIVDGSLTVLRLSQMEILTMPKNLKQCRLIVRNLSFKCKEEDLRKEFSQFGELTEVKIPIKPDGKMFGFGFVQFLKIADANKALKEKNAKPILGRPVAVDWAVPKTKYENAIEPSDVGESGQEPEEDNEKESDDSDEEDGEMTFDALDADVAKKRAHDSDDDDDDTDDKDEDDKESGDSEDSGSSDDDSDDDSDDEDDDDTQKEKKKKKNTAQRKSDVDQGRTLFVRNLPFDAEEEDVGELFEPFGELCYRRVVMDPKTEHSRGCAFVQFKEKTAADECLASASEDQSAGLVLEGRRLNVILALPRERAKELKKPGEKKEAKDNRNLYLVREGLIRPGTQSAEGLSPADIAKRSKIEGVKRQKLKNENIFVSTTRLCVHNIPVRVDDKELKTVFLKAAEDSKATIIECRVMRDMTQVNGQGIGKSRGFAFVNFTEHAHALQVLRTVNNNPEIFGENKRPIVEFSLENKLALLAKEKRVERMKTKQTMMGNRTNQDPALRNTQRSKKLKPDAPSISKPSVATSEASVQKSKGPKGLPSHWGPKIRHKARPAPPPAKKVKKQVAQKRSNAERREMSNLQAQPKQKKRRVQTDDFDKLVHKYQHKLTAAMTGGRNKKATNTKWFDT